MTKVHRGKILHEVASLHKMKIIDIVEEAGYTSQSTFYKHISEENLPFKTLFKYAKVMNYYFANEIPEFKEWLDKNGLGEQNIGPVSYAELQKDRDMWREKYYSLLEEHNKLIKDRFSQK